MTDWSSYHPLTGRISSEISFGCWFKLMDATPINNRSVLPRTIVTLSQNRPGCICLWALPSTCCQQFDHLFVWFLPFDLPGLVRPARSWTFRQYGSQGWSHKCHRHYKADDFWKGDVTYLKLKHDIFRVIWRSFWGIYTHAEHQVCGYYTPTDWMITRDIIVSFCIFS